MLASQGRSIISRHSWESESFPVTMFSVLKPQLRLRMNSLLFSSLQPSDQPGKLLSVLPTSSQSSEMIQDPELRKLYL